MADKQLGKYLKSDEEVPVSDYDRELVGFINNHRDEWRNHRDTNYLILWNEYERMFRGIWSTEDKSRDSERSRIVTPAMQQAIEAKQAEISEAVFGRGDWFDIEDDRRDQDRSDVALVRQQMHEDFKRNKIKKAIDNIILLAEIYGTGIGEITVKEEKVLSPATQPIPGAQVSAIGVQEKTQFMVNLNPVNCKNFLIDPNADSVEDSLEIIKSKLLPLL